MSPQILQKRTEWLKDVRRGRLLVGRHHGRRAQVIAATPEVVVVKMLGKGRAKKSSPYHCNTWRTVYREWQLVDEETEQGGKAA